MSSLPPKQSARHLELVLLTVAIVGGYIWLQLPLLSPYSLQGFALAILLFFGLKFFSKYRHQFLPGMATYELVPLAFALMLLVGATGACQSMYFALLYIFLLLLVLSCGTYTSIIVTGELVLFLYALSLQLQSSDWQQLVSLPLMLGFFLYIKYQLGVSNHRQEQLTDTTTVLATVSQQKMTLEKFVREFLKPKLATLAKLGQDQQTSKQVLLSQLDLLENEIDKMLAKPEQVTPSVQSPSETESPST